MRLVSERNGITNELAVVVVVAVVVVFTDSSLKTISVNSIWIQK